MSFRSSRGPPLAQARGVRRFCRSTGPAHARSAHRSLTVKPGVKNGRQSAFGSAGFYNTLNFWRATAIDAANGVTSATSGVQSFTPFNALWPGQVPTGTHGHAILGPGWNPQILTSFDGHQFQSPPLDETRVFDLLDLGYEPQAALDWMNSHGYPTQALYYPSVRAVGFLYTYVALVNGSWELVLRAGA